METEKRVEATYQALLKSVLAQRVGRNPRYSLRSLAKSLGMGSGALSQIISGKRIPSFKTALKIGRKLDLPPTQLEAFVSSLGELQMRRNLRRSGWPSGQDRLHSLHAHLLADDVYHAISDWYHYAILELTYLEDFRPTVAWVSKQLGISLTEAKLAVDRLLSLGLLSKDKRGRWIKTHAYLETQDRGRSTSSHRKRVSQILSKAIESLEHDPIEIRSMTTLTLPIDLEKLPQAKKLIEEFNQKMLQLLSSEKRDQVYELSISLFPLQKFVTPKEKKK